MSDFHGQFVWCELMTTDPDAATAFYARVVGWTAKDAGIPGKPYTILSAGGAQVGGLLRMPSPVLERGGRPGWIGYIGAADVDAAAARVREAGGAICHAAEDIPGIGRFAVVRDPQGATFALFRGAGGGQPPAPAAAPGHVGWHELGTSDREAAFAFYADLFGWTRAEALDLGPMGTYQLFAPAGGGRAVGGMMTSPVLAAQPSWLHVFNVEAIDAAGSRVAEAGGQVTDGPHPVPGGAWVIRCSDPQDATFALVAPAR